MNKIERALLLTICKDKRGYKDFFNLTGWAGFTG
jgi:hypothetical protein